MHRSLLVIAATAIAAAGLGGCTKNTTACKDGTCQIDLEGKGASAKLGDSDTEITLVKASGGTAQVQIGDTNGELTTHKPIIVSTGDEVELEKVEGPDDVQIRVTSSTK